MQRQRKWQIEEIKEAYETYPAAPVTMAFFWCSLPIWMLLMVRPLLAVGVVAAMM